MPGLADPEVGRNIIRAVRDVFERPQAMDGALVSPEVTDRVVELLPDIIPSLMRELTGLLRRPAMRGELEMRGRFLLHNVLDRLTLVQKFFIGASLQYWDCTRFLQSPHPSALPAFSPLQPRHPCGVACVSPTLHHHCLNEINKASWRAAQHLNILYSQFRLFGSQCISFTKSVSRVSFHSVI